MRRPKLTIRRAMLAVVGISLVLGLGIPAIHILGENEYHHHTYMVRSPDGREMSVGAISVSEPFWPRYSRYLQGKPWRKQPLCRLGTHQMPQRGSRLTTPYPFEACELAHPAIIERLADGSVVDLGLSPDQEAEYLRQKARDPRAVAYRANRKPFP